MAGFSRRGVAVAALLFLAARGARAEVRLQGVRWQFSARPGPERKFIDVQSLRLDGGKLNGKLRARLRLDNRGPRSIEGILLRYSMAAKVKPISGAQDSVWAVAFLLEERRIPKLGPNHVQEIALDSATLLQAYLNKQYRAGYVPDELKISVMVEPHQGDPEPIQTLESVLSFVK